MLTFIIRNKNIFKQIIFTLGIAIVILSLISFTYLTERVKEKSKKSLEFRISVYEEMLKNDNNSNTPFLFKNIINNGSYPVILTDREGNVQNWINIDFETEDKEKELKKTLEEFKLYAKPIPIRYDSLILSYYYYGEPLFLKQLHWLPIIVLTSVVLLVLIAYYGIKKIRVNEEQFIWFGMAKEAAHQLGTPTSSLSGWIELLKEDPSKKEYLRAMEADLTRIETVINRFSLIGSIPKRKKYELNEICQRLVNYFRLQQPQLKKKIEISFSPKDDLYIYINRELIVWVLENLIRNAMDAIQSDNGRIEIEINRGKDDVKIRCIDNGTGINSHNLKHIFDTGFSTKRRGWGIGLSLSKRIIHEFHNGKLSVEKTKLGKGTTFLICLKRNEA